MLRAILIGVLSLGVIGTGVWGYQEHREKNALLLSAENNYQRAFHELTYQIDLLHDQIGTTLAMNSRKSLSPALADVWRITSEAQSDVGQLPLTLLPFNKTEEFLAKIGDFSYRAAIRDLDKEPLSDDEMKALKTLYGQSKEIQDELRKVQHLVIKNNLRWMDVELALVANEEPLDNTIIDGFKTVEKTVEGYDETDFGVAFVDNSKRDQTFSKLEGKTITEKEALEIGKKYANFDGKVKTSVVENGKGSDYGFYSVSIQGDNAFEANLDITKKGGYPIWFIQNRDVKEQNISLNDATNKASSFLKENNFKDLQLFESTQFDNIAMLTFVRVIDKVRIYPEAIKVKVALDNGTIIGFSSEEFLQKDPDRELPKPKIAQDTARKNINPNVKVMEEGLAIIINDLQKEVLCYEFLGTLGNDTYRIFINAEDGTEEKVEKLQNAEPIYDDLV